MQRTPNAPVRISPPASTESIAPKTSSYSRGSHNSQAGSFWDMLGFRIIFTACCVVAGFHFRPFSLSRELGAAAGFLFALGVILFEVRLRRASLRRLIGAVTGSILGILGAYLSSLILSHTIMPESTRSFFSLAIFLVMTYVGL